MEYHTWLIVFNLLLHDEAFYAVVAMNNDMIQWSVSGQA